LSIWSRFPIEYREIFKVLPPPKRAASTKVAV
jgi:hypothetical protein